jgi:hypothetical protein
MRLFVDLSKHLVRSQNQVAAYEAQFNQALDFMHKVRTATAAQGREAVQGRLMLCLNGRGAGSAWDARPYSQVTAAHVPLSLGL